MSTTEASPIRTVSHQPLAPLTAASSPGHPLLAGAIALAIFLLDTITSVNIAIAVLYVGVVLMSVNFRFRHAVVMTTAACVALAITGFVIMHGAHPPRDSIGRFLVSLSAIGITAFLALRICSANVGLSERANLLDLTHDAVLVRDMTGIITYWNRGAEQLYGWTRAEVTGRALSDLTCVEFSAPIDEIMDELLRTGRWEGELVQRNRSGEAIHVESRWSLQRDERGRPAAVLETNTDVTKRRRAETVVLQQERALQQAQAELAHVTRLTTLGELTASIAHEVNQPLAAIVTNGEACLRFFDRDVPDVRELRDAIRCMLDDSRRAGEVIRRLRALSRKAALQKAPLHINDVIDDAIRLVRRELSDNRVALRLDLAQGLPPVMGDRVQLQQVIINLAMNGIDAMQGVADTPRELLIRSRPHRPGGVLVAVEDSGVGIAAEIIDRLFDAFFTTKPGGLGMGLSICRSIIEAHDGKLWASSTAGQGATFQFTLSCSQEAPPDLASGRTPS